MTDKHHFTLTTDDEDNVVKILTAFYIGGGNLTYSGPRPPTRTILPTYEELMTDSDNSCQNTVAYYADFRFVSR